MKAGNIIHTVKRLKCIQITTLLWVWMEWTSRKQIFRTQNCKIIILVCLHTHVTGAILHTKAPSGNFNYCFVELVHYHHDSNLMCWSAIQNRAVAFHNCCTCWCKENKINMFWNFVQNLHIWVPLKMYASKHLLYDILKLIPCRFKKTFCLLVMRARISIKYSQKCMQKSRVMVVSYTSLHVFHIRISVYRFFSQVELEIQTKLNITVGNSGLGFLRLIKSRTVWHREPFTLSCIQVFQRVII